MSGYICKREGFEIISVVLFCSSRSKRAESSKRILDYAFNNYKPHILLESGQSLGVVSVKRGLREKVGVISVDGIKLPLTQEEKANLKTEIIIDECLDSPVHKNIKVGTIKFSVDGEVLGQSDIKTAESVGAKTYVHYLKDVIGVWFKLIKTKERLEN